MLSRRNGLILAAFVLVIVGFAFLKPPTPHIAIAAESLLDLGGYTITNTILSAWVVILLMTVVALWLYRRLRNVESALVPRGFQNLIEALLEAFYGVVLLVAGEKNARRFFPVIGSIFIFLLIGNWFGLFPWNNAIGKTIDERAEYLEELAHDAEGLQPADLSVAEVNAAFAFFYLDPIPVEVGEQDEANETIAAILHAGAQSDTAQDVRQTFQTDPLPDSLSSADLFTAVEERLAVAGVEEAHLEEALFFNLPLAVAEVDDAELKAAIIKSGGVNFVPLKAKSFTYDPFFIQVVVTPGVVGARLYDPQKSAGETNQPPLAGDRIAPVTVNTAHLGLVLTREAKGLNDGDGIGVVFPLFRAVATDLNLSLAIALWAFIFVQFWSIQSMGALANFGRFFGFGPAAVVKGPIGVMVGLLEIISEVSRIISFTFRLFGNILAGEIVLLMSAFLVPFVVATVFYGLEVFVGFIQAFVFAMLTLVFAVTAVSHASHDEPAEHDEEAVAH